MSDSKLFQPLSIGNMTLNHRLALAPLTRFRASDDHTPLPIVTEYYRQRSSVPGTFLITEGTVISPSDGGFPNVPGIWNDAQIATWRTVTEAVHRNGSYIYMQLWSLGRAAMPQVAEQEGFTVSAADAIPDSEGADSHIPQRLTMAQIRDKKEAYVTAARNAIAAGFDGIELHGANGYIIDQFLQDVSNQRDDEYGGSVENRSRFAVEVAAAVAQAIGPKRTAIRLSPWNTYGGMGMADPVPQFSDVIAKLARLDLAYLHLVESRIAGNVDVERTETLDFAYDLWKGPILVAGGFGPESARVKVDEEYPGRDMVVVFGRHFISTPDLPFRVQQGLQLAQYNRSTFYNAKSEVGYTDYPFSEEFVESKRQAIKANV